MRSTEKGMYIGNAKEKETMLNAPVSSLAGVTVVVVSYMRVE